MGSLRVKLSLKKKYIYNLWSANPELQWIIPVESTCYILFLIDHIGIALLSRYLRKTLTFGEIVSRKVQNCMYLNSDYTYPSYKQVFKLIAKVPTSTSKNYPNLDLAGRRQGLINVVYENLWFCSIKWNALDFAI